MARMGITKEFAPSSGAVMPDEAAFRLLTSASIRLRSDGESVMEMRVRISHAHTSC